MAAPLREDSLYRANFRANAPLAYHGGGFKVSLLKTLIFYPLFPFYKVLVCVFKNLKSRPKGYEI
jgi:hypothetical protein